MSTRLQSIGQRYRESPASRLHIHVARFVLLFAVIAVGWTAGITAIVVVAGTSTAYIGFTALLVGSSAGAWLPALVLVVAWAARERGGRGA